MSFILDGLKKLEKKHPKGSVPNLSTIHEPLPEETGERRLWPLLLSAVLLLNAVILMTWLLPRQSKVPEVSDRMKSAPERETVAAGPAQKEPVLPALAVISSAEPSRKQQPPVGHSAAAPAPGPETEKTIMPAGQVKAQQRQPLAEADDGQKVVPDISPAYDPAEMIKTVEPAKKEELSERGSPSNDDGPTEENPVSSDISDSLPEDLPDIKISGHVYSDNPGLRMVVIDNNIMKEGDLVAEDLELLEITSTGAIFSYKGRRFSMEGF